MSFDISKYIPINTKEKVDRIIFKLSHIPNPCAYEILVLQNIRKLKMQVYFNEMFKPIKSRIIPNSDSTNHDIEIIKKSVPADKLLDNLPEVLEGKSIQEISSFLFADPSLVISAFINTLKNNDITQDYKPSLIDLNRCDTFLRKFFNKYSRKIKLEYMFKKDIENFSYKRFISLNNQKSYGKEGNYGKLIYIRTKS